MSLSGLRCGKNVIQFIFPIKVLDENSLDDLMSSEVKGTDYMSEEFACELSGKLINDGDFKEYLIQEIKEILFPEGPDESGGMRIWRCSLNEEVAVKRAKEDAEPEIIEVTSFEIYHWKDMSYNLQSDNNGFLVVRLNYLSECSMEKWLSFLEVIRYKEHKYYMPVIYECFINDKTTGQSFISWLEEKMKVLLGEAIEFMVGKKDYPFTHALVSTPGAVPDDPAVLVQDVFQIMHLDGSNKRCGTSTQFKNRMCLERTYDRWGSAEGAATYYTCLDYASMAVHFGDEFTDNLIVTMCRHYLLILIIMMYYKNCLLDIIKGYGKIQQDTDIRKSGAKTLKRYYSLNEHYFFGQVTVALQGNELWGFYLKNLGIDSLYQNVREDMKELYQRLIEHESRRQNVLIMALASITLITGFFGMNVFPGVDQAPWLIRALGLAFLMAVVFIFIYWKNNK